MLAGIPSQLPSLKHALVMLPIAALLGAALGVLAAHGSRTRGNIQPASR
jgi:hypothetical protein